MAGIYQHWLGAKIVKGPMKDAVASELLLHATEELSHADMLAMRIIQLGGTLLISPDKWLDHTHCGYDAPTNPFVKEILTQNIKGEQCAIDVYQKLLKNRQRRRPGHLQHRADHSPAGSGTRRRPAIPGQRSGVLDDAPGIKPVRDASDTIISHKECTLR